MTMQRILTIAAIVVVTMAVVNRFQPLRQIIGG